MPYYHVRISHRVPESNDVRAECELDLSEEDAKLVGEQYQSGKVFFNSKWINADNINEIDIQETDSKSTSYSPTLDSSTIFYGTRIETRRVTRQFIKSEPKKVIKKDFMIETAPSNNIFIVHGRDDKPKLELARMLDKLGFNVIILSEQPDKGRTIIEKLEQETIDIGYAFVILTPDDIGVQDLINELSKNFPLVSEFVKNRPVISQILNSRARQNVILELGYFVGKIGRNRVCCLYNGDVELPSDIHGVLFKRFDKSVEECYKKILEELKAARYEIKL